MNNDKKRKLYIQKFNEYLREEVESRPKYFKELLPLILTSTSFGGTSIGVVSYLSLKLIKLTTLSSLKKLVNDNCNLVEQKLEGIIEGFDKLKKFGVQLPEKINLEDTINQVSKINEINGSPSLDIALEHLKDISSKVVSDIDYGVLNEQFNYAINAVDLASYSTLTETLGNISATALFVGGISFTLSFVSSEIQSKFKQIKTEKEFAKEQFELVKEKIENKSRYFYLPEYLNLRIKEGKSSNEIAQDLDNLNSAESHYYEIDISKAINSLIATKIQNPDKYTTAREMSEYRNKFLYYKTRRNFKKKLKEDLKFRKLHNFSKGVDFVGMVSVPNSGIQERVDYSDLNFRRFF